MTLEIRLPVLNRTKSFQYEAERILRTYHKIILGILSPGSKADKSSKNGNRIPIKEGYDTEHGQYYYIKNWIKNKKKDRIVWLEN